MDVMPSLAERRERLNGTTCITGTLDSGETLIAHRNAHGRLSLLRCRDGVLRHDAEFVRFTAAKHRTDDVTGWARPASATLTDAERDEFDHGLIADRALMEATADPSPPNQTDPDAFAPLVKGGQGRTNSQVADAGRVLALLGGLLILLVLLAIVLILVGELRVDWRVI